MWIAALVLLAMCSAGGAEQVVLTDVPAYIWFHGCSPTAGMMVHGYWDAHGYPDLIPGSNDWNTNRAAILNAIASVGDGDGTSANPGTPGSGHVADYALYGGVDDYSGGSYADLSSLNPSGAHSDDSLADFMDTSRSVLGLPHGASYVSMLDNGMRDYAAWLGYSFVAIHAYYSPSAWDALASEIRFGRPALLNVDSNGDGRVDHTITVAGFRDTNGYEE